MKVRLNIEIEIAGGKTLPVGTVGTLLSVREDAPYGHFAKVDFGGGIVLEVETWDVDPVEGIARSSESR